MSSFLWSVPVVALLFSGTVASAALVDDVELGTNGKPVLMSHKDASYYCLLKGLRLPSAREFIEEARTHGVRVRDTSYPGMAASTAAVAAEINANKEDGFYGYTVKSIGSDVGILFYYDSSAYQYQNKPLLGIWSSSICPKESAPCPGSEIQPYRFNVGSGAVSSHSTGDAAVVCVK